jgi:hypothetical protein
MEINLHDKTENGFSRIAVLNDFSLQKEQALRAARKADLLIRNECRDECDPVKAYEETLNDLETRNCRTEQPIIPGLIK